MRNLSISIFLILITCLTVAGGAARAGEGGVGQAKAVIDMASATGQIGARALTIGAPIYLGDVVATYNIGEAQLLFQDGTRMVVGPNSSMVIEEFLFRGTASENKFAVRALGGAFRFISGDAGARAYEIRTPSGTIGVRG